MTSNLPASIGPGDRDISTEAPNAKAYHASKMFEYWIGAAENKFANHPDVIKFLDRIKNPNPLDGLHEKLLDEIRVKAADAQTMEQVRAIALQTIEKSWRTESKVLPDVVDFLAVVFADPGEKAPVKMSAEDGGGHGQAMTAERRNELLNQTSTGRSIIESTKQADPPTHASSDFGNPWAKPTPKTRAMSTDNGDRRHGEIVGETIEDRVHNGVRVLLYRGLSATDHPTDGQALAALEQHLPTLEKKILGNVPQGATDEQLRRIILTTFASAMGKTPARDPQTVADIFGW